MDTTPEYIISFGLHAHPRLVRSLKRWQELEWISERRRWQSACSEKSKRTDFKHFQAM